LFLGALLTGPFADRFGRRPVFAYNMLLLGLCAGGQYFVESPAQLFALRLVIGFLLGTDYVVSKAMLTEFTPRTFRGRLMSTLSVAWAGGYTCAYFVGYLLSEHGPDAWRWMLACSALPCALILPLRLTLPESPLWFAAQGRLREAAAVVARRLGPLVAPPHAPVTAPVVHGRWAQLFSPAWRRRTLVGCIFFTCQVIPYFAVGTFVTRVLDALHVRDSFVGGLAYNLSLLSGAVLGLLVVDRMPRRAFLVGSFTITALAMLLMIVLQEPSRMTIIALFAVFAGVLSAASNLCYVYLPELFPTHLRASGIGLAIASSRIGSAASTFLLPLVVSSHGVHAALAACVAVLAFGGLACYAWAPETRNCALDAAVPPR
jgi:putative MFS transporter